jgi:hypothetical protein
MKGLTKEYAEIDRILGVPSIKQEDNINSLKNEVETAKQQVKRQSSSVSKKNAQSTVTKGFRSESQAVIANPVNFPSASGVQ